jgi:hypothetical protein
MVKTMSVMRLDTSSAANVVEKETLLTTKVK